MGVGDNGKGDKTEAERDVDRALHVGLGRVGFHYKDRICCTLYTKRSKRGGPGVYRIWGGAVHP